MIGRTIGSYTILEKIGEGGMGTVYRGVDELLEREVGGKGLRPELAHDERIARRFRTEAVTLGRLSHPHIATLYTMLQDGGDLFMVMEFVRGRSLEEMLHARRRLPLRLALRIFEQALDGIAHAHAHGIVHRDIKPGNIMVTEDGQVKVMDFGIARVLGGTRMTKAGHLVGTLEYMAPEQVRGRDVDARTDIYALGVLLYELLTGRVPFRGDSDYALIRAHVEDAPPPPRQFSPDLPEGIEAAILRALEKAPDERFPTATAFRDALSEVRLPTRTAPTRAVEVEAADPSAKPSSVDDVASAEGSGEESAERDEAALEQQPAPPPTRAATEDDGETVASRRQAVSAPPPTRAAERTERAGSVPVPTRAADGPISPLPERPSPVDAARQGVLRAVERARRLPPPVLAGSAVLVALLLVGVFLLPGLIGGSEQGGHLNPADSLDVEVTTSGMTPAADTTRTGRGDTPVGPVIAAPSEPESSPSEGLSDAEVQTLFEQANDYVGAGQLVTPAGQNALETCLRILAARPAHEGALGLIRQIARQYEGEGDAQMQQRRYQEAVARYRTALTVAGSYPGLLPDWQQDVRQKIENAETRLAARTPAPEPTPSTPAPTEPESPQTGTVRIVVRPYGDIYVNGTRKASSTNQAFTEQLAPGTYRVRVQHPVFGQWERRITVRAGQTQDEVFNFNATFRLTVTSQPPNAEILVDGEPTGRYTPSVITLHPGQRTIAVRRDGYASARRTLSLDGAPSDPLHFPLSSE
jgi:serine/threonine-protein kinase